MENIIQILIVIGIIVVAIVKRLNDSTQEAKKKRSKGNMPKRYAEATEMEMDNDLPPPSFLSFDYEPSPPPPAKKAPAKKPKITSSPIPPAPEAPDAEQEFIIDSAEEVRRGIIWSEILQRKY